MSQTYFVYILRCADSSLYTGITTDVGRRVAEHNGEASVTKYTRSRRPVEIVYCKGFPSRSEACREESRIKKLRKAEKIELIQKHAESSAFGRNAPSVLE